LENYSVYYVSNNIVVHVSQLLDWYYSSVGYTVGWRTIQHILSLY